MQGEHSQNLFQKEKVLYTSATKAGESSLRLLGFSFTTSAPPVAQAFATCRQGGRAGLRGEEDGTRGAEDPQLSIEPMLAWLEK